MPFPETPDSNLLDQDPVNWRFVVYPIVGVFVLLFVGCGIYFHMQKERLDREAAARQALLNATTPAALAQVADDYPGTTHAALALIDAGNMAFDEKDYETAKKSYQRVAGDTGLDAELRDSAQLGYASALEAAGSPGLDTAQAYLVVARRGKSSPYAPFAYAAAARLYAQEKDTNDERTVLSEAAGLGGDSPFTRDAQAKLQALDTGGAMSGVPQ